MLRVVRGGNAPRMVTADRRPHRVNVDVRRGVIVFAEVY
jgi:hypothetical protein